MNKRVLFIAYTAIATACAQRQNVFLPFTGALPADVELYLDGVYTLSGGGLQLALTRPCVVKFDTDTMRDTCTHGQLDWIQVIATPPWNQKILGTWIDAAHIVFPVDWATTGLDPLYDRAVIKSAWGMSGRLWSPSETQAADILRLISDADKAALVRWGRPPKLEATASVKGDRLRAGSTDTLVVTIANHGSGAAYRVVATTRSSIEALHGKRLSFGILMPGAAKTREMEVKVPASETAHDALVVFELSEGNGVASRDVSNRIPIEAAVPILDVQCEIEGHKVARPDFYAGERLPLRCTVDNTGTTEAKQLELEVLVVGGGSHRSAPQVIPASGSWTFNLTITVPRTLPIDATVSISITARDRPSSRTAPTTIVGVIRKPKLCVQGQLTRAQYRVKIDKLRDEVKAGNITQAEFYAYDAQLVACL
jgi:hypothetical protein